MMPTPKYVQRFARLPAVLETLAAHPDGLPLHELAAQIGAVPQELREDLLAFYTADVGTVLMGLSRPDVLEFLGPEGDSADPATAEIVRVTDERPTEELGVENVDARELALVYAAARALLEIEPDNADLNSALDVLTETLFGEPQQLSDPKSWNRPLEPLQRAVAEHRRVRIVYSRVWHAGVTERVIEPHRLVQTRRGWEVDAGPPDQDGRLRTFLLSNVRDLEVLDEGFTPPSGLERLLEKQRATTTVRVELPHAARWAADFFSERVELLMDDEYTSTLDLTLLPPVYRRVGLLLLAAGEESKVLEPAVLIRTGPHLAEELLTHHRRNA
jgi:predicted DNA-binding transcriptional regulator YafY